ncbi:MAG: MATE family efflux transporter [Butyricicoccus sp.]
MKQIKPKKSNKAGLNLTQGPIGTQLFLFALPFFGSSLIQQLYNTIDLMFVGNVLGKEASAAVGSSSLLVTCLLSFFTGISVGVGVLTAKASGARDGVRLKEVIHTSAALTVLGSLLFLVLGWMLAPILLRLLNTPEDILPLALVYIRIYFLSLPAIVSYNMSAGILRAMGDSRSPMMYQLAGGLVNVAANALFLCVFRWGVAGAALATLCSQGIAAVLTVRHLFHLEEEYRLRIGAIRFHGAISRQIFQIGIPAAVQAMIITLSNLLVQSQINNLGVVSIAAFTAYFKVENFIYLPIMAIGQASANFFGQNLGAGQPERARKGTRISIALGVAITVAISAMILLFCSQFFRLFTSDLEVIEIGRRIAFVSYPWYFLYVFLEVLASTIRSAGKALPPMLIVVVNMCGVRLIALITIMNLSPSAPHVAVIYPITWICTVLCLAIYYRKGHWMPCGCEHDEAAE